LLSLLVAAQMSMAASAIRPRKPWSDTGAEYLVRRVIESRVGLKNQLGDVQCTRREWNYFTCHSTMDSAAVNAEVRFEARGEFVHRRKVAISICQPGASCAREDNEWSYLIRYADVWSEPKEKFRIARKHLESGPAIGEAPA
jgi:hypothetical protein